MCLERWSSRSLQLVNVTVITQLRGGKLLPTGWTLILSYIYAIVVFWSQEIREMELPTYHLHCQYKVVIDNVSSDLLLISEEE